MKNTRVLLLTLFSMVLIFSLILPASAAGASATMPLPDDHSSTHSTVDGSGLASPIALNTPGGNITVTPMVAAGWHHIVGLRSDGAVLAAGYNELRQCEVSGWANITQVAAGMFHTVGLKNDGTAVAAGYIIYGQCNVGGWTNITQVDAGNLHTVGVNSAGTVVAVGVNTSGECNVGNWTNITQVAAGNAYTVGVNNATGKVVAVGWNQYGQCNVTGWTNITQVAAGTAHTVGVTGDGHVVAVGLNNTGQCDVTGWTNITQVAAGFVHTVGLMSNGTVVTVGANSGGCCDVSSWANITQVAASPFLTLGLMSNGTVLHAGIIDLGQCNVGGWTGIDEVAAGAYHTVGLNKTTGNMFAVGWNYYGQLNVGGWTNITQVAAGWCYTVGLNSSNKVLGVGDNTSQDCDVGGWNNITQIAARCIHTVGLMSNGTVVAVGENYHGQCNVGGWTNITQVAAGRLHTVGLNSSNKVRAVGWNGFGQCNVGSWKNITQIAAGRYHTVGLNNATGQVVAVGLSLEGQCNVTGWTNITQVSAGMWHTVGLKSDGTVVATGSNYHGQCDVTGSNWTDIVYIATGYVHTVGVKSDGTVVAVGGEVVLPEWNLQATEGRQFSLTVFSTAGGYVDTPGEGTFYYDEESPPHKQNLAAATDTGYCFVCWTGDVSTIADVYNHETYILVNANKSITARFTAVTNSTTQTVTNNTVDATSEADTEVSVNGTAEVTVSEFADNPGGYSPSGFNSMDKYIDVYIPDTTQVNEIQIRVYYTSDEVPADIDENSLKLFWWNGHVWQTCDPSGVNTTATPQHYVWAEVRASGTTPTLAELEGTPFAPYGSPPASPVYSTVITQAATGVLAHDATLNMNYTVGNFSPVQVRFAYKRSIGSQWSHTDWVSKNADGTYATPLVGLPSSTYDFKAQLMYDDTVIEGNTLQFSTPTAPFCFIATAAYGTPMAEEIQILREFRDKYLLTNSPGRALVDFYYNVSPPIAEFITAHPSLKPIVRAGLVPVVAMSIVAVNASPAEKMAIAGLLALVSVTLAVWVIRRRGRDSEYT